MKIIENENGKAIKLGNFYISFRTSKMFAWYFKSLWMWQVRFLFVQLEYIDYTYLRGR